MDTAAPTTPAATGDRRRRPVPRRRGALSWLTLDTLAWCGGLSTAAWTRFEFTLTAGQCGWVLVTALACAAVHASIGQVRRSLRGHDPVGSLDEARELAGTAALAAASALLVILPMPERPVPATTPVVGAVIALLIMAVGRSAYRYHRDRHPGTSQPATRALIYGVDATTARLVRALRADPLGRYLPVGLLDDELGKRDLRLDGVRVLGGRHQIGAALQRTGADTVIFCMVGSDTGLLRDVRDRTVRAGATFKVLPPLHDLLDRPPAVTDVRDIQLTDLLGRAPRAVAPTRERNGLRGRRVLVTGAGGSIGSELCQQIARCEPGELMMLDRDESALHALQMSLYGRALLDGPELILADIRDAEQVSRIIAERRPEIVFHAAALKHLPLLQRHPGEAVKTNILGTLNVLEACRDVAEFVNISTDKAADPISVLGYSKRLTEQLTAHYAARSGARYLSVRFGNVLSSRGSVLTAFRSQLAAGLPITVTHPDVTRYFMTKQEAVHLVLQAATIGRGGEALVLDMGEPVRIADVARRLADESATNAGIVFTGLRPGEKLHEDLFGADEIDTRPIHPLISHVGVPPLSPQDARRLDPYAAVDDLIAQLAALCAQRPALSTLATPR
ncbi:MULTISPECIES: nucleoside-diphosphate sugar epimerase/dehydratase [Micromonospora]|uniref:NDP-sugar epimerase, includes UDP-GlcNAc-inverting 4,6-dehydratase FlaA1 and capsular polysaccharide biosynthesis protein EpsC n=1 Tax=Micromonospora yangpuensis TaxID=683228 RepID=A0A1C6UQP8_9ACTN|nr:nucleoside-diphosphate sugar epimerase/dehydratase [Micromonospora yangpuensis]GGM07404.1 dTDP-glucose 4,6-dehydratase [Micromonospora yangpuensis]SCL56397.1 NDP-sugar epimerase, includes UDP-GlcNAc-inverting 4,6-dehydratase FlaA1 and capsular polysaccharide biosynthesis protein EpsC [Micromonospora yangpuensis]